MRMHYGIQINSSEDQIFGDIRAVDSCLKLENDEYDNLKCIGDLDNIFIYSLVNVENNFPISSPPTDYLRNIFLGLKKSFSPYSEYIIIYYIYRLEGIKNIYDIKQLTECFLNTLNKDQNCSDYTNTISSNTESKLSNHKNLMAISEENENNTITLNDSSYDRKDEKDNETVKCSTYITSQYIGTPEKEQLNQYSYIFDLHHLPIFDENNGEFFWSNNEANWKSARDSILKSEELNAKSISLNHGSLVSLSSSYLHNNTNDIKVDEADKRWNNYKKDATSNTFINDLSNLLKNFEN